MSEKHSLASKKRWARISPEERSKRMQAIAIIKHAKMTPEEKKAHLERMNKARLSAKK